MKDKKKKKKPVKEKKEYRGIPSYVNGGVLKFSGLPPLGKIETK